MLRDLKLNGGERILDVGSGLGQFSRAMARASGKSASVIGIERDQDQLSQARQLAEADAETELVEFRQGDALDLPLQNNEWQSFDITHTRFLLEHVQEPIRIVSQMKAATRPGGRVVLADDDHGGFQLWPEPLGFPTLWQAYIRAYQRLGNDPFVGRKLVSLLHCAGLTQVRNATVFFGGCAGNDAFDLVMGNLLGVFGGARQEMLDNKSLDQNSFDDAMEALVRWGDDPTTAMWYSLCYAEGFVPLG